MAESLITPYGILSFPHLFTARAAAEGATPRFSCSILFNKEQQASAEYAALKAAVRAAIAEEWGDAKAKDAAFLKTLRNPFRDAAEKEYEGYDPGMVFIAAWNNNKPGVVNLQTQPILDPADVWAGQLARLYVRPFAYQQSGNKGVSFSLQHVQILKSEGMRRLDGRKSAEQAFGNAPLPADLAAAASADAGDEEIPF
jgi:hypothetical protein